MTTEAAATATTETPASPTTTETPVQTDSSSTDLGGSEQTSPETTTDETDLGGSGDEGKASEEDAPPAPGAEFQGAPEGEASYEPFTMPDGYEADEELTSLVAPIGKELNLNQKGMQKLVDLKPKMDQIALERWKGHLGQLKKDAQADPEIGGAKYAPAVAAGRGVIAKFGTDGFRKMLNQYGVGAHPEMIRFLGKIAAATGETSTPSSEGGSGGSVEKPLHELLYGTKP